MGLLLEYPKSRDVSKTNDDVDYLNSTISSHSVEARIRDQRISIDDRSCLRTANAFPSKVNKNKSSIYDLSRLHVTHKHRPPRVSPSARSLLVVSPRPVELRVPPIRYIASTFDTLHLPKQHAVGHSAPRTATRSAANETFFVCPPFPIQRYPSNAHRAIYILGSCYMSKRI